MTVDKMRDRLTYVYGGPVWQMKVREMSNRQVIAVYSEMERSGRLKAKNVKKHMEPGIKKARQLTIFDMPEMQEETVSAT